MRRPPAAEVAPYLGSAWKRQGQASDAKGGTPADTPKEEKTHLDARPLAVS